MPTAPREFVVSRDLLTKLLVITHTAGPHDLGDATAIVSSLGPLGPIFDEFIQLERGLTPIENSELIETFERCLTGTDASEVITELRSLAPGSAGVGYQQVLELVDHCRRRVDAYRKVHGESSAFPPHDSAFGSGGDLFKTPHVTTEAAMVVASPGFAVCKVGTNNVTSQHGSVQAIGALTGRSEISSGAPALRDIRRDVATDHFAFAPLASLGFDYSGALVDARRELWDCWLASFGLRPTDGGLDPNVPARYWRAALDSHAPIDIFKVVSPNFLPLGSARHSTGVFHRSLLPYVIAIYLHRNITGFIVHGYDGTDELAVSSSNPDPESFTTLLVYMGDPDVVITEVSPELLGLQRHTLRDMSRAGTLRQQSQTFRAIVAGQRDRKAAAHRDFVIANAALLTVAHTGAKDGTETIVDALAGAVDHVKGQLGSASLIKKVASFSRGATLNELARAAAPLRSGISTPGQS